MLSEKLAHLELGCIRRAILQDKDSLNALITRECGKIFGEFEIENILELSFLPVCQMDIFDKIIGFLALDIFPNCPSIPEHYWLPWMHDLYGMHNVTERNSLFVHMICWKRIFTRVFLRSILESLFKSDPLLKYIIIVMPPNSPPSVLSRDQSFSDILLRVDQRGKYDNDNFQYLYVAIRERFCSKLKVRRAVEEDNDDLVEIIQQQTRHPKELYGDFYISELIAHPLGSERVILVGEDKGVPVGVMILNTQINYKKLNNNFELDSFCRLKKLVANVKTDEVIENFVYTDTSLDTSDQGDISNMDELIKGTGDNDNKSIRILKSEDDSNDSFLDTNDDSKNDKMTGSGNNSVVSHSSDDTSDVLLANYSDDDYDIVNVDDKIFMKIDHFLRDVLRLGSQGFSSHDGSSESENSFISLYEKLKSVDLHSVDSSYIYDTLYSDTTIEDSAFIIEVFAMDKNFDERAGFDILEAAFEVYPDLEYCIISIPSNIKTFPLLDHFVFVPQRSRGSFDHCLYVLHRNCIRSELIVRDADVVDSYQVDEMVKNLPCSKLISHQFESIVCHKTKQQSACVMVSEKKIVALAILEHPYDDEKLRVHYMTTATVTPHPRPFLPHANLQQLIVAPQFQQHSRFFLREVLRLSQVYELIWQFQIYYHRPISIGRNVMSAMSEFVPLLPRHIMDFNWNHFLKYKGSPPPQLPESNLNILYINPTICSYPKVHVNSNIVVVGASSVAFDFIEAILFGPSSAYLTFNNITLLSNHGIPYVQNSLKAADLMMVKTDHNNKRIFHSTPFQAYINVVTNTMMTIKRAEKCLIVTENRKIPYDLLFLFCGEQYQHPEYLKDLLKLKNGPGCRHTANTFFQTSSSNRISIPRKPGNLFIINDIIDANVALNTLQGIIQSYQKYQIIVYGATIDAYTCVTGLLEFGVPGYFIAFVEPFPPKEEGVQHVNFFNNEYVDDTVRAAILKQKVQIYTEHYFHSWDYCRKTKTILSVSFISYCKMLELKCTAMFYYGTKGVNINTFLAINESGLVYNGRLVINSKFQTNDPQIFAAGPLTKYSQKYGSPHLDHKHFSSCEVGFKLGELILYSLNPFANKCVYKNEELYVYANNDSLFTSRRDAESNNNSSNFSIMSAPSVVVKCPSQIDIRTNNADYPIKLKSQLINLCTFPGGLNYLMVKNPGLFMALELAMTREDFGRVLITNKDGYFRIHLNAENNIKGITCLTEHSIDVHNISSLWSRNELILNKLLHRFEENQISDFYEYFKQPWAYALYHDKFENLLFILKEQYLSKMSGNNDVYRKRELINIMRSSFTLNINPTLLTPNRRELRRKTQVLDFKQIVTNELIQFIEVHEDLLPMYSHTKFIEALLRTIKI